MASDGPFTAISPITNRQVLILSETGAFSALVKKIAMQKKINDGLKAADSQCNLKIQELEARLRDKKEVNKHLMLTRNELQGKISVLVVLSDCTLEVHQLNVDMMLNENSMDAPVSGKGVSKKNFTFDKVLDCNVSQDDIFKEISQTVQSAIDGFNVCIVAYGEIYKNTCNMMIAMMDRAIRLQLCKARKEKGWVYKFEASFLEIYNEEIRDLLGPSGQVHEIRVINGEVTVTNLQTEEVINEKQVDNLVARAKKQRAVASATCLLKLKVTGRNESTDESSHGFLYMVDIASSEHLKESGATGDHLTETKNDKSLSGLREVIMAISAKETNVPYRNSKLTLLLQQALGGTRNAKLLMLVNVPKEASTNETINSLTIAAEINACHIGRPLKGGRPPTSFTPSEKPITKTKARSSLALVKL